MDSNVYILRGQNRILMLTNQTLFVRFNAMVVAQTGIDCAIDRIESAADGMFLINQLLARNTPAGYLFLDMQLHWKECEEFIAAFSHTKAAGSQATTIIIKLPMVNGNLSGAAIKHITDATTENEILSLLEI